MHSSVMLCIRLSYSTHDIGVSRKIIGFSEAKSQQALSQSYPLHRCHCLLEMDFNPHSL